MDHTHAGHPKSRIRGLFPGPRGDCVRLVLSWTMAGGVAGGGMSVGVLTAAGAVNPGFHLLIAPVLFLVGSLLGLAHGGVLAVVARTPEVGRGRAIGWACLAGLMALPLLLPAYVITAGISLTSVVVAEFSPGPFVLMLTAWTAGVAVCAWAAKEGWHAVARAYARWPQSRAGSVIAALFLVVVTAVLLRLRPEIAGTGLKVNGIGAVALAVVATIWIGLPLVITALRLAPHGVVPHPGGGKAEG